MAPSSKAKAKGVSASSFLDLKAELAKQETEFGKKGKGLRASGAGSAPRGEKVRSYRLYSQLLGILKTQCLGERDCMGAHEQGRCSA